MQIESWDHFRREVNDSKTPVVVMFTATWCPPCQKLKPHWKKAVKEWAGKVKGVSVDTEKTAKIANRFGVQTIPSFVTVGSDGKILAGPIVGGSEAEIKELFKSASEGRKPSMPLRLSGKAIAAGVIVIGVIAYQILKR